MSEGSENTGQISVAELLARNGQQVESRGGRRRRGVAGGITVAELTGEIPVVRDRPEPPEPPAPAPVPEPAPAPAVVEPASPVAVELPATPEAAPKPVAAPKSESALKFEAALRSGAAPKAEPTAPAVPAPPVAAPKPEVVAKPVAAPKSESALKFEAALNSKAAPKVETPAKTETAARREAAARPETAAMPLTAAMPQMRTITPAASRAAAPTAPAEEDHTQAIPALDKAVLAKADAARKSGPAKSGAATEKPAAKALGNSARTAGAFTPFAGSEPALLSGASPQDEPLRKSGAGRTARNETLDDARAQVHTTGEFPRITDADGGRRSRRGKSADDAAPEAEADSAADDPGFDDSEAAEGSPARQWAVLAGQALVAVVAGGLLFKGFETLWEMLPWVALVLAVLVIAGLVAVVRILRQTDDMVSLLIAVIVGVFVTIGPLAFVLSSS
ncbi:hypothetical protein [Rhodococcus tukisamuensis]|uniref:Uncharacterized protein n=1 Tax=Rhodococcus tukisamuensis TaxID=168276 RepID=A0A1G6W9K0_9NOCA|nr:hypothetical protein [Rhodococcus tukisamuensis]SDD62484.1 hypothetical protein SAMN05444580_105294 [Rhodococcus tukisamuensis]